MSSFQGIDWSSMYGMGMYVWWARLPTKRSCREMKSGFYFLFLPLPLDTGWRGTVSGVGVFMADFHVRICICWTALLDLLNSFTYLTWRFECNYQTKKVIMNPKINKVEPQPERRQYWFLKCRKHLFVRTKSWIGSFKNHGWQGPLDCRHVFWYDIFSEVSKHFEWDIFTVWVVGRMPNCNRVPKYFN
jgi:hypothetical protein